MPRPKPKPMSEATRQKGREYVAGLINEGFAYVDMLDSFRIVVALESLSQRGNSPQKAAELAGTSSQQMRNMMDLAGVSVKRRADLVERGA